jgi:hypothetical protein
VRQLVCIHNGIRRILPALLVAVCLGFVFDRPAQAGQLITDGTFLATSDASPGGFLCQNGSGVGSTCTSNLTYWTPTCSASGCVDTSTPASLLYAGSNGDVDVGAWNGGFGLYPTVLNPPGGGNVIAIDGGSPYSSSIAQMVQNLVVGQQYILSFYQGAAQQVGQSGATTEQWKVTFGGSSQSSTLMNNASAGVVSWQSQSMSFIATSTSELLTFLAIGTPNGEPPVVLLADVSMVLPEPGSAPIIGTGLLVLLVVRRRTRAAAVVAAA